jgi:hypothetical protein
MTISSVSATPRRARVALLAAGIALAALVVPRAVCAQVRVGSDSSTRLNRFGRDLAFGTVMGFAYAGVDQWRNDPPEWGNGGQGYAKRLASNVGEFVIQETVTDILAAAGKRPLDYQPSPHHDTGARIGWALQQAVTDRMPDDTHPVAYPRIIGAYAGSFAQAAWRPNNGGSSRARVALVNGTTSLLVGAGINLWHEFRR